MVSRINPLLTPGDIVTDPRSLAYYVVTEYGGVNLVGCSTWERAERLISVAHPKFRDELVEHARQQGIWIRSNRSRVSAFFIMMAVCASPAPSDPGGSAFGSGLPR